MSRGSVRPSPNLANFTCLISRRAGAGRWLLEDQQPIADVALKLIFRASAIVPLRSCEDLNLEVPTATYAFG
jgi:hypothetical protein